MVNPNISQPFPGLTYQRESDVDIITWSNKETPKNAPLYLAFVAGFIVVTGLGIFLALRLLTDINRLRSDIPIATGEIVFSLIIVLISWAGVVLLGYYLIRLSWTETIKISKDEIRLLYRGLFSPKEKRFPAHQIYRLSFERVGNERDRESRYTLNLFNLDEKRETLAYWIRAEENYQLFLLLDKIFTRRGWSVQSISTFQPGKKERSL